MVLVLRVLSIFTAFAGVIAASARGALAQVAPDLRRYADRITTIADSAIEKAAFYTPQRLAAQVAIVHGGPPAPEAISFDSLAQLARSYARDLERLIGDFDATRVPADVERVHAQLVAALTSLRVASDTIALAARFCARTFDDFTCRAPLGRASNAFLRAQVDYMNARRRATVILKDAGITLVPYIGRPFVPHRPPSAPASEPSAGRFTYR